MGKTFLRVVVAVAVGLTIGFVVGSAAAFAAPPTDPPGRSGDAPGHQKREESDAADPSPPGAPDVEQGQAAAPVAVEPAPAAVVAPAPASVEQSPRFENATGKPKKNVPAAAEAAPESSVSAPGNSGRHKLTICHKGHAITVDVHAARAHVDGHGDTYAAAGARGRAACPQPSGPTPSTDKPGDSSPRVDPGTPDAARLDPRVDRAAPEPVVEAPAVAPAGPKDPAGGVSAAAVTQSRAGGVASTATSTSSLPFTGASLPALALLGLGLVAAGSVLVATARRPRPASARRR